MEKQPKIGSEEWRIQKSFQKEKMLFEALKRKNKDAEVRTTIIKNKIEK